MWFFFLLSAVGFIASVLAHVVALGGVDLEEISPAIRFLPVGIFLVWIPVVMLQKSLPPEASWKARGPPKWLGLLMIYAFAFLFVSKALLSDGEVYHEHGKYVVKSHGNVTRQISEAEYHRHQRYDAAAVTGIGMPFYAAAMSMLASGLAAKREPRTR